MGAMISKADSDRIVQAVKEAELNTSGEIRVHIQRRVKGKIYEVAKRKFEELGMTATALRNGVLFFVAMDDRQFSVLGDSGIDEKVPEDFWSGTVEEMTSHFKEGDFPGGIEAGVLKAGQALKEYFPYQDDDINELSDEISIEE